MKDVMTQLQTNQLEQMARNYAALKASEFAGEMMQLVLDRTDAQVQNFPLIERAEREVERRLAGIIKHSLVEFTEGYTRELQHIVDAVHETVVDSLMRTSPASIFIPSQVKP